MSNPYQEKSELFSNYFPFRISFRRDDQERPDIFVQLDEMCGRDKILQGNVLTFIGRVAIIGDTDSTVLSHYHQLRAAGGFNFRRFSTAGFYNGMTWT
mgnify:FL=1